MHRLFRQACRLVAVFALCAVPPAPTFAQAADNPHSAGLPPFFAETFLNFPEDVADAAKGGKRLLLYFGQDGCPYCTELIQTNFAHKAIADLARDKFLAIGLNMWGDRETAWFDGTTRSEKDLARHLKVQFTPTVLLFDERGGIVARINGYYPPHRFFAALDYAARRLEGRIDFAGHMQGVPGKGARATLGEQPFFMKAAAGKPLDLSRRAGGKPLAVLFETRHCAACDEVHDEGFKPAAMRKALARFDVARIALGSPAPLLTPNGEALAAGDWARVLKISYTPSVVFFDDSGREVFRLEAYLRPSHLVSSFEYVGSGAYRKEPEFQRFLQRKDELMME